jgi:hypothetical protein
MPERVFTEDSGVRRDGRTHIPFEAFIIIVTGSQKRSGIPTITPRAIEHFISANHVNSSLQTLL